MACGSICSVPVAVTLDVLPAGRGDCLWVECHRPGDRPWRLLVDGGLPEFWPTVRARIDALPADDRRIDLVVVSHIDSDHIGGVIPLFTDADLDVEIGDVWFNGLPQLPDAAGQSRSVRQGENLVELLSGAGTGDPPPWNEAFGRSAVVTEGDGAVRPIHVDGWPVITLLSPTPKRLVRLRTEWERETDRVRRGEPSDEEAPASPRRPLDDLSVVAATVTAKDSSAANGSSIAFLLEHRGTTCLLGADAFASVLGAALTTLANRRGGIPIELDVFKLPHHASRGNVLSALVALAPARHYVVSTNGDRFDHPDDEALARVVVSGPVGLTLWFNHATAATERWGDPSLRERYGHDARYPGDAGAGGPAGGIRIELEARP